MKYILDNSFQKPPLDGMMILYRLPESIDFIAKSLGISHRELAHRLNVDESKLSKWRHSVYHPSSVEALTIYVWVQRIQAENTRLSND